MIWGLKGTLIALSVDLGSVPSSLGYNFSSKGSDTTFWLPQALHTQDCTCICADKRLMYIKLNKILKKIKEPGGGSAHL